MAAILAIQAKIALAEKLPVEVPGGSKAFVESGSCASTAFTLTEGIVVPNNEAKEV
eukprot:CAMPEP_0178440330 /NCGR_PEP_ID=MMETSP0689_2-20121128/36710_1 /TAXON_ID=160604 /ORGANISM="Amphidinium massartii, Strain CS-259" /LENGTH=55 /DNA_ID=CAMNT_0020063075 /DNA_START=237 /DNA_END=404 /DNA_ORIENTATION=+